ncbi:unnamed protein product [Rotaria sp. Silwood2]|nr:unnamed protein product [Rotaria sp. Silwood2]CAF2990589.1 unnamed protein product [Rotaria sp. Silwood2]CAF3338782.1 unnamed protein product [Rotaria sp. Silwood2]CAF4200629.1 unnamed protein product [Rotaria sp. Silwood2]CAF4399303.1 unnamed protein product [Rotaria sp. Silwood2]
MVKDMMFRLANGQNMILTGDFNIKPWKTSYRAILERGFIRGRLPLSSIYSIHYHPNTEQVLKSAYLEKNGSEPAFTAFSSTPNSPDFCATTDYIFFAGHLTVDKVLPLPSYPNSESYPDAKHPSDHLMIAATFRFN